MNRLKQFCLIFLTVPLVLNIWLWKVNAGSAPEGSQANEQQSKSISNVRSSPAQAARGKYLVEEVAKCAECHTPRDSDGNLRSEAWLQGAPIWIMPVAPIRNWADQAPALAGLPFTDVQMERVLEKGVGPEGETLRPPMHIYHMHQDDARAIIAYLKSVPPAQH